MTNSFSQTPAPNAYDSEKGEEYLEGGIKHSFGVKPDLIDKFKERVYLYGHHEIRLFFKRRTKSISFCRLQHQMLTIQRREKIISREASSIALGSNLSLSTSSRPQEIIFHKSPRFKDDHC